MQAYNINRQSFNNMHNHTPKEPIHPNTNRDRPLQKSMFLPEHYPPAPSLHSQPSNEGSFNPLKRSLIDSSSQQASQQGQYQFRTNTNNNISLHAYQPPKPNHAPFNLIQSRAGSSHQLLQHSNSTSNMKHLPSSNQSSYQFDPKNFTKVQKGKTFMEVGEQGLTSQSTIITQVLNQIKEKHLPALISVVKKEFQEEINAVKQEFMIFKEEVKHQKNKQEQANSELRMARGSQTSIHGRKSVDSSELSELQKDFFLLEGKMKQIESSIHDRFSIFRQDIDKISLKTGKDHSQQNQKGLSASSIRSSLSPIMLEYKQFFAIKTGTGESQGRKSIHEEIKISQCQYYIDKNGFLLDQDNHYLVDRRGSQVRLDDKHLKLLQKHKILQK